MTGIDEIMKRACCLAVILAASCTCEQSELPRAGDLVMVEPPEEMLGARAIIDGDRLVVEYEAADGAAYTVTYRIVPSE